MSNAIMPLSDVTSLAQEIVKPYESKLSDNQLSELTTRICMAIFHAQYDAAIATVKEFQELL